MPGGPGGPGGPGIPVGPRMPSLPCKSHRSREQPGLGKALPPRRAGAKLSPPARGMSGATAQPRPGGTHLLGRRPRWPSRTDLPWEARGALKRRGVLSREGGCVIAVGEPSPAQPAVSKLILTGLLWGCSLHLIQRDVPVCPW